MTRGGSFTLIGCLALVLGLPGAASLVGLGAAKDRLVSGRPRPPPLQLSSLLSGRFGHDMSDWVFDVVPFKASLSRLDSLIDVAIFRDSPAPGQLVLGQRGFAFRIDGRATPDPQALLHTVMHLDAEATRAGRRLLVAVSPSKASLYPEYLPAPHRRSHAKTTGPIEASLQAMSTSTDSPVLDVWGPMRVEKKRLLAVKEPAHRRLRFVFRPTDDHWSFEAGQVQARVIVTAIDASAWHDDRVVMTPPYVFRESELNALFLHAGFQEPYVAAALNPDLVLEQTIDELDGGAGRTNAVTTFRSTSTGSMAPLPRRVVVVHDGFLTGLPVTPGPGSDGGIEALAASFAQTTFVPWDALSGSTAALLPFFSDADVVVVQVGEAQVGDLMVYEDALVALLRAAADAPTTSSRAPHPAP